MVSDSRLRHDITVVLKRHALLPAGWFRGGRCACGWRTNRPSADGRSRLDQYRAHLALHLARAIADSPA